MVTKESKINRECWLLLIRNYDQYFVEEFSHSGSTWLIENFLNNDDWFMIRHEHFNTYMEWKFKSLRIWPSEKSIEREFRLRHFWKFFWDNNQKSFWDSCQMFTLNHPVHHNDKSIAIVIRNDGFWNRFTRVPTSCCHEKIEKKTQLMVENSP